MSPTTLQDDGDAFVADWGNNRLQVLSPDEIFIAKMTSDATMSKWGKEKLDANPFIWHEREVAHGLESGKLLGTSGSRD